VPGGNAARQHPKKKELLPIHLKPIDIVIIAVYLLFSLSLGIWMQRRASKGLNSYFLGDKKIPWWILGMSGSSTYFDITGTMWIVSTFFVLGMKGMWVHWLWCFPFAGFALAYQAKWARRSPVLTSIEWYMFRFGEKGGGKQARMLATVISVTLMALMLGYAGTGIGKFVSEYVPWNKNLCVVVLFVVTGVYVILGGFFSVAFTDLFQTILLSLASIYISIVAFVNISPAALQDALPGDWHSLLPVWKTSKSGYELFGLMTVMWVSRGVLMLFSGAEEGAFQRFRAARNDPEASKVGLVWGLAFTVRWVMVMAIVTFGLTTIQGGMDPEKVLPRVVNTMLPAGIKGLVLAGLLAAFMSTFDSTLNVASSFIVNDFVKPLLKKPREKTLMLLSYVSTFLLLGIGIVISFYTENIRDIWNPINFALGSCLIFPGVLKRYWWRFNGWAMFLSGLCVMPTAAYIKLFHPKMPELEYFPILAGLSLVTSVLFTFLTRPAEKSVLTEFYRRVRPFGRWGRVRKVVQHEDPGFAFPPCDRHDLLNAFLGTGMVVSLYLTPMYLMLRRWWTMAIYGAVTMTLAIVLYFTWYRMLGEGDADSDDS
jgi:SSS family solute:Na+ symporter